MLTEKITFLDHLNKLKDKIDLIQQKTSEGLLEFFGEGIHIEFSSRALPNAWETAGTNKKKLEVEVIDDSTTFYVKELNGNQLLNTRLLTESDIELLNSLYKRFRNEYNKRVEYFDSGIYYLNRKTEESNEPGEFIEEVIKSIDSKN